MAEETVTSWNLMERAREVLPAPTPDETWPLQGGKAYVYYSTRSRLGVTRPVILSDGFHPGPTNLDKLWDVLERGGGTSNGYDFATKLRSRGYDLIILGYDDCSASILDNAKTATECIFQTIVKRVGTSPLAVGGFSMGGLITRYALAKMERESIDHQTAVYICYDSPHHGAWMPISLQALAHALRKRDIVEMSDHVNSPASRQLLWRHIEEVQQVPRQDPLRTAFLDELKRVGGWPQRPRKIGVANGKGTGSNNVPAGVEALTCDTGLLLGTKLLTQATGINKLVAAFGLALTTLPRYTTGMPAADGAHGGKLDFFEIAAEALRSAGEVTCHQPLTGFVPTGSAIAIMGADPFDDLGASVLDARSSLDDFKCASQDEMHTLMTEELGGWIIDKLPGR